MVKSNKNSKEKLKILYESSFLCFQSLNEDGIFIDINPAWLRTLGYNSDEVIGKNFKDFLHPQWKTQLDENLKKLKKVRYIKDVEFKIQHKNGNYLDVEFEGYFGYKSDGSFEQIYCIFQDITERKKAQYDSTFISGAILDLIQFKTPKEVFIYTVNKLYDLFNRSIIITGVEYDNPNNKWKMREVKGINSFIDDGLKKIGIDLRNWEGEINTRFLRDVERGKLVELELDLHALTNGKVSGKLNSAVKKLVPIKKLLVIPIKNEEFIYGTITLVITKSSIEIERKLNETFITQVAVFVEKLIIESELRENENKLKAAEKIAHVGNYEIDINTSNIILSEETCRIFGLDYVKGKELSADEFSKLVYSDDSLKLNKHFTECISEIKTFNLVYRIVRNDNEIRYVHRMGELELNESGVPIKMFGTIQDITEQVLSEQKLRESEERFDLAMKAANDGIFDWNLITNEIYYSPKWKSILGYKDHEIPNDFSIWETNTEPEDVKKSWEMQQELVSKKRDRFVMEFKMKHKDGHWVDILSRAEAVFDDNGKATRIVGTHQDISDQKRSEAELLEAKQRAEQSDFLKSAFLANMSHEIRTPMNGILGFLDLMNDPALSASEQSHYLGIVKKSGTRLLQTINDIIELSRIEAGEMPKILSEVNINETLQFYHEFFMFETKDKGLTLLLNDTQIKDPLVIKTDKNKLDSILTNLIKNAIKFTKKGSIEFGVKEEGSILKFYVKDTGIGIPTDKIDAIFDRFIQADLGITRGHEGSGLGLAICNAYVKMLGGDIWVESEINKGSIFYFSIENNPAKSVKKDIKYQESFLLSENEENAILVAEDDDTSFYLMEVILSERNAQIIRTVNGKETVEFCERNPNIDLVIMDIKMPVMDGIEATRQIRKFNEKLPIIAQTAYALEGDREKMLDAGCNDYISKPIRKNELIEKISELLKVQ